MALSRNVYIDSNKLKSLKTIIRNIFHCKIMENKLIEYWGAIKSHHGNGIYDFEYNTTDMACRRICMGGLFSSV